MSERSAFLASLPGAQPAATPITPAGPDVVALAQARARAIAARVHDLQRVFGEFRLELLVGIHSAEHTRYAAGALVGEAGPWHATASVRGRALGGEDDRHTPSAMVLRGSSSSRAADYYSDAAREMEEQFEALVRLLAKQAAKLTDDLAEIILLAQARIEHVERTTRNSLTEERRAASDSLARLSARTAQQVRDLVTAQAVERRRHRVMARCFASWWHATHRTITRSAWRRQAVQRAVTRLARCALVQLWRRWLAAVHSSRLDRGRLGAIQSVQTLQSQLERERSGFATTVQSMDEQLGRERREHEGAMKKLEATLESQWGACVRQCRARASRQLLAACVSAWAGWAANEARLKSKLFLSLGRLHTARVVSAYAAWQACSRETKRLELTRMRALSRVAHLYITRAWQDWISAVDEGRWRFQHEKYTAALDAATGEVCHHRKMAILRNSSRALARGRARLLRQATWCWCSWSTDQARLRSAAVRCSRHAAHTQLYISVRRWHTYATRKRSHLHVHRCISKRLDSMRKSRALQQWIAACKDSRGERERLNFATTVQSMDEQLGRERREHEGEMKMLEATVESQWGACVSQCRARASRQLLAACVSAWAGWVSDLITLQLRCLRALSRIGTLYQNRAWQQWLAIVDEGRVVQARKQYARHADSIAAVVHMQRELSARHFLAAAQRWTLSRCMASWVSRSSNVKQRALAKCRANNRRRHILRNAAWRQWRNHTSWQCWCYRNMQRVVLRLGNLYLMRAWTGWVGLIDHNRLHQERIWHDEQASAAAAALSDYRERIVKRLLARATSSQQRRCLDRWASWIWEQHRHQVSLTKVIVRVGYTRLRNALRRWYKWLALRQSQRLKALRVSARIGYLICARAWQTWSAGMSDSKVQQERADFSAVIDSVDSALSLQWEACVRQYLLRQARQRLLLWFSCWLHWSADRAARKKRMYWLFVRISAIKLATAFARWNSSVDQRAWRQAVSLRVQLKRSILLLSSALGQWCVWSVRAAQLRVKLDRRAHRKQSWILYCWSRATLAQKWGDHQAECEALRSQLAQVGKEKDQMVSADDARALEDQLAQIDQEKVKSELQAQLLRQQLYSIKALNTEMSESLELATRREKRASEKRDEAQHQCGSLSETLAAVRQQVLRLQKTVVQQQHELAPGTKAATTPLRQPAALIHSAVEQNSNRQRAGVTSSISTEGHTSHGPVLGDSVTLGQTQSSVMLQFTRRSSATTTLVQDDWREDERLTQQLNAQSEADARARHTADLAAERDKAKLLALEQQLLAFNIEQGID